MKISQTTDRLLFQQCAQLMSESEPFVTLQFDLNKCLTGISAANREVYIVEVEDAFAGFVVLFLDGPLRGYIQTICVKPEFRNQGLGTHLLQFCIDYISKTYANAFLCVSSFNHRAQSLYYSLGFEKVGELKDHIVSGHDEYILRKQFAPIFEYQAR